jgi:FG-GAP-like repeat
MDGDGMADLFLEQDSGKKMKIWFMNGDSIDASVNVTSPGFDCSLYTLGASGDVDGDGKADIIWRKNSNGDLRYFRMNGATVVTNGLIQAQLATTWVGMGGGDLNGDGTLDLGFRSSANGNVLLALVNSNFTVTQSAQLSLASGFTFIGFPDVNGDGRSDLIWRKDSDGKIVRWKMNGLAVQSSTTIGTGPNTANVKTHAER